MLRKCHVIYRSGGYGMKFRIVVEYDPATKSYAAYCPELPGCCSAGDTEKEALANAKEAIALYLEPSPSEKEQKGKVFEVEVILEAA